MQFDPALPPSLSASPALPPPSPRDFFESVNRFCLVKLPTANRARHTTPPQPRPAAAGWMESGRLGHGQQAAAAEEGGMEGRGSLPLSLSLSPSLARSLTHSPFIAPISFDLTDRPTEDGYGCQGRTESKRGRTPSIPRLARSQRFIVISRAAPLETLECKRRAIFAYNSHFPHLPQ